MKFLILPCFLVANALQADDWPQFLGPQRNNVAAADARALPDSFPADGPKVLWQADLGSGHAGPAVVGDRVILCHRQGPELIIESRQKMTGAVQWIYRCATDYRDSFGMDDGPRATPTVSGDCVVVHHADGQLVVLDLATGKLRWSVDTAKRYGSPSGYFGRASAPLVVKGMVILTIGAPNGKAIAAFDLATGQEKWTAGDDESSYASPVMVSDHVALCWLRHHLTTLDITSGRVMQRLPLRPEIDASVNAATPIKTDDGWFVSAEYDLGASLWSVGDDGALKQTWHSQEAINCHYATPVCYQGHVYGFDGRQERGQTLRAWDQKTQRVVWSSPKVTAGTVMLVKDRLLVLTEDGELWVVSSDPVKFNQIALAQILGAGHRSYPAYAGGVLYARDAKHLVAVQLAP
jgi:outer membrane protein assembly factor BamB